MTLARVLALALAVLLAAALATAARADLPRAVARAFLDAGMPLNRVAVVVQEVGEQRGRSSPTTPIAR